MHEKRAPLPAGPPALIFSIVLSISPGLLGGWAVVSALAVIACLLCLLPKSVIRSRVLALVLAACCASAVGTHHRDVAREGLRIAAAIPGDRFVVVRAMATRPWAGANDDRHFLAVKEFELMTAAGGIAVDEPLSIYLTGAPPLLGVHRTVIAEGFLRRYERRWYLNVKSPELLSLEGRIRRGDPRFWNRTLSEALERATTAEIREPVALARALALGQSDRLPADLRNSYIDGGTYHLLVFSGLQIGFAAAAFAWVFRGLRRPALVDGSLLLIAVLAPVFAGNEPSVTRSSLMIGVWALARLSGRPTPRGNLLFVAAMARLCMEPQELTDPGFALTFAATSGLALSGPALARVLRLHAPIARSAVSGLAAEAGVLPFTIFFFSRYVFGGWMITMLVSPLIVVMLGVSFLICFSAVAAPSFVAPLATALSFGDAICRHANAFADGVLGLGGVALPPPAILLISAVAAGVVLLSCGRTPLQATVILVMLAVTASAILRTNRIPLQPGPSITSIDVGQGDATLISDGAAAILVDGGGSRTDPRFGDRVLIPALLKLGARTLDAVVVTHPHPDHCGGLPAVILRLNVREVWISGRHLAEPCSQEIFEAARRRGSHLLVLEKHPRTIVGGIRVRTITHRLRYKKSALNNGSVLVHVEAGTFSALLTGDIEKEAEFVLTDDGEIRRARVLKVPHHGSRTSSTNALLEAVNAEFALISSGAGNVHRHPHEEVLERLRERRSRILRTDLLGTTTIDFSSANPAIRHHVD